MSRLTTSNGVEAIVLSALRLLEMHPSYRFVLDQVCLVKPFLERHPEQTAALRPFRLELGGIRPFPSKRHPVAIVLDVGPPERLEELAEAVERGVTAAGFDPEPRPFRAHLTLGRVRGKRFPVVTGNVTAVGESCAVDEAVLFKSELHRSGAHYTPIEHAPLGDKRSPLFTETDQSI